MFPSGTLGTSWSLPSWERGLKFTAEENQDYPDRVAPLVGAWIEIQLKEKVEQNRWVAPLVGAWIEIHGCF